MTQKQTIIDYMKQEAKPAHYSEIAKACNIPPTSVRGIINISVKKQETFIRLGKGMYSLKE